MIIEKKVVKKKNSRSLWIHTTRFKEEIDSLKKLSQESGHPMTYLAGLAIREFVKTAKVKP